MNFMHARAEADVWRLVCADGVHAGDDGHAEWLEKLRADQERAATLVRLLAARREEIVDAEPRADRAAVAKVVPTRNFAVLLEVLRALYIVLCVLCGIKR